MRLLISREVERVAIRKSQVLILRIVDLTSSYWYLTVFCPVDIQYVQIACQGFLHMFFSTFSAPSRSWRKRRMRSGRIEQQSSRQQPRSDALPTGTGDRCNPYGRKSYSRSRSSST